VRHSLPTKPRGRRRITGAVLGVAALAAAAVGGFAATAATSSTPASSAVAYHACVSRDGHATLYQNAIFPNTAGGYNTPCPTGYAQIGWAAGVGAPSAGPVTATANTAVSDRDDSGDHGNWAKDAMIRTVSVTRQSAVEVSKCGGAATDCWYYTGTITDAGTFQTVAGALSPRDGVPITGVVSGTFTGGSKVEFYASSNAPNASLVPATVTGDVPSTTNWVKQIFPRISVVSTPSLLNWSWSYSAPNTCETWVDAFNNNAGADSEHDIQGVNHC
jgi:hypothetical protein